MRVNTEDLYTRQSYAAKIGVTYTWVRELVKEGRVKTIRVGEAVLIHDKDTERTKQTLIKRK